MPPSTAATLLVGLGEDSRVRRHLSGNRITLEQALLAIIVDRLNFIAWTKTEDAHKGRKYRRKSIFETLTRNPEQKKKDEIMSFNTVEEYDEYMKRFKKEE